MNNYLEPNELRQRIITITKRIIMILPQNSVNYMERVLNMPLEEALEQLPFDVFFLALEIVFLNYVKPIIMIDKISYYFNEKFDLKPEFYFSKNAKIKWITFYKKNKKYIEIIEENYMWILQNKNIVKYLLEYVKTPLLKKRFSRIFLESINEQQ